MSEKNAIVRPVQILRGYRDIAAEMRTSDDNVRDMVAAGAPIYFEGEKPKAEAAELWLWYAQWMDRKKNTNTSCR